jgi:glycosyltransferase involved in cell wall biosynthesis
MTRLTNRLDHQALQHVDVAFVENSWMEEHLNEILGEERVVFAPPGVETDQFTAGPSPSTCNYLLSVGRFADPRKNVTLLFEAYARVQDRLDEAPRLVLVGRSAPSDEAWARAEALGIRSAVTFHEDVSQERLSGLYRNAALYVVSSNEEGLGLTILEAMASGRPVVSTRCGGPSTAVIDGQTGVTVPKKSASTLTEALVTLLEDPTRADQMGKRGRERVEQHFSAEATGQRFLEVYDRILGGSA